MNWPTKPISLYSSPFWSSITTWNQHESYFFLYAGWGTTLGEHTVLIIISVITWIYLFINVSETQMSARWHVVEPECFVGTEGTGRPDAMVPVSSSGLLCQFLQVKTPQGWLETAGTHHPFYVCVHWCPSLNRAYNSWPTLFSLSISLLNSPHGMHWNLHLSFSYALYCLQLLHPFVGILIFSNDLW
jgi:hypothetical protein